MADLSFNVVSALLQPDFDNGKLFWRERPLEFFNDGKRSPEASRIIWNARHAGKEAMTAVRNGYSAGSIFDRRYYAHRVMWLLAYGEWPKGQIDHINGDRLDNRLVNLRDVSHAENGRNAKRRFDNKSGVVGVRWFKQTKKWYASIVYNGETHHLGYFSDFSKAAEVRRAAEVRFGYHENHGRRVNGCSRPL